jgi:NTP pyrophosphatase (non-canonical NTP hydrolase)
MTTTYPDDNKVVLDVGEEAFDWMVKDAGVTATEKGFWRDPSMMDVYAAKLALVHSEVTEVLEALRKSQGPDKVTEEFADIFIRCFDLHNKLAQAGEATPDLYRTILAKLEKNSGREAMHGNRWG